MCLGAVADREEACWVQGRFGAAVVGQETSTGVDRGSDRSEKSRSG